MRAPEGFTKSQADAYWLWCDTCDEGEIFFCDFKDESATAWAAEHRKECSGG